MHVRDLLRGQFQLAHNILEQVIDGCEGAVLHDRLPGGSAQSIAATYAHAVYDEDLFLTDRVLKQPTLFRRGGWAARTGVTEPAGIKLEEEWAAQLHLDLPSYREYAAAVYQQTDDALANMTTEQLDAEFTSAMGTQTMASLIGGVILNHIIGHSGEIAAQKGARGITGLPF